MTFITGRTANVVDFSKKIEPIEASAEKIQSIQLSFKADKAICQMLHG